MSRGMCVVVVSAICKLVHGWRDLPVRGVVLFRRKETAFGAKISLPVSVLHQSLCLCFTALLQELHIPNFVLGHVQHLLVGRNQSPSLPRNSVYVLKYFAMRNSAKWVSLLSFHHSSLDISVVETSYEMHVFVNTYGIIVYEPTATQHCHTMLGSVHTGKPQSKSLYGP